MMEDAFLHIDTWIFDLDLTLYSPEAEIMSQVRTRIAQYVENYFKVSPEEADEIRHGYWQKYGTTLGGLMAEFKVDPHGYLDFVHDVDMTRLLPDQGLRASIDALPGRKVIFTNADAPYAERILAARGLENVFEDIFDIHRMKHLPKPAPASYNALCSTLRINPETALFVEDSPQNLAPAKALGMTTVWVRHCAGDESGIHESHIDHEIADVLQWLSAINVQERAV